MKRVGFRLTVVGPADDGSTSSWLLESIGLDGEWKDARNGVSSSFAACVKEAIRVLHVESGIKAETNPDLGVVMPGTPSGDEIPFASPESIHAASAQVTG